MNLYALYLIKQFEGIELAAYHDVGGVLTIGYGHTGADVVPGMKITANEADDLLMKDAARFEMAVDRLVTAPLTEAQKGALISFTFNVGVAAFAKSTLLKKINKGDVTAPDEFLRWVYVKKKKQRGLLKRRRAERQLFIAKK